MGSGAVNTMIVALCPRAQQFRRNGVWLATRAAESFRPAKTSPGCLTLRHIPPASLVV